MGRSDLVRLIFQEHVTELENYERYGAHPFTRSLRVPTNAQQFGIGGLCTQETFVNLRVKGPMGV